MDPAKKPRGRITPASRMKPDIYGESFQDVIRDWFRSAPWFVISILIHATIGLILVNVDWRTVSADQNRIIQADYDIRELEPLPIEKIKEEKEKIEPIPKVVEEPQVRDVVTPEEILEPKEEQPITVPDTMNVNDVIGVGNGWNPQYSGKYRMRHQKGAAPRATQQAVENGLDWLARHQDPEGFWDCDGFDLQCHDGRCTGPGAPMNDVGVTGLALLAFLGTGNTPLEGPYQRVVRRGIHYLCEVQDPDDGCLAPKENSAFMYNHAIACLALTEAYGLSDWPPIKKHARMALEYVHKTKNPGKAWRYNSGLETDPSQNNDVSVTGWMIMCLASAHDFNLPVDQGDLTDALNYIEDMTDPTTGRTGYIQRGDMGSREPGDDKIWPPEESESMTAVGMLCRVFCGNVLGNIKDQEPMLNKGADLLRKKPPRWNESKGTIDFYYWYYGSYAMFQMGGRDWSEWKESMLDAILPSQSNEGCSKGSWDPRVDPWGDSGGRVYSTALCTLCLEVFYRYGNILGSR